MIAFLFLLDSEIYYELSVRLNARKLYISETISSVHYSSGSNTNENGLHEGESGFNACGLLPGKQSPSLWLNEEHESRSTSSLFSDHSSSYSNVRGNFRLSEPGIPVNHPDTIQLRNS